MRGKRNVVDLDGLRALLAARCADADERRVARQRPSGHRRLRAHLIAGVDQHVDRARQQRGPVVLIDELFDRVDDALGVNVEHALAQGDCLGLPERRAHRLHLPVDVRLGHMVEVDQGQCGDTAAGQSLGCPRADAAEPDDRDSRGAQSRIAGVAVQTPQAAEAALEIGFVHAPILRSATSMTRDARGPPARPRTSGRS